MATFRNYNNNANIAIWSKINNVEEVLRINDNSQEETTIFNYAPRKIIYKADAYSYNGGTYENNRIYNIHHNDDGSIHLTAEGHILPGSTLRYKIK
jgi:hypothetical protein